RPRSGASVPPAPVRGFSSWMPSASPTRSASGRAWRPDARSSSAAWRSLFTPGLPPSTPSRRRSWPRRGVEGRLNALEGGMGFLELFGGKGPAGWGKNIEKLGAPMAAESRGLMFKRYPCCASTHRVLDAFFELRAQEKFKTDDVESINTLIGYGN